MKETAFYINNQEYFERLLSKGLGDHPHQFRIGECLFEWWCATDDCARRRWKNLRSEDPAYTKKAVQEHPNKILPQYGITHKFFDYTLENFKKYPQVVEICQRYIKSENRKSILILGSPGTGKTHIAIAIMQELIKAGIKNMQFKSTPDLLMSIRRSYDDDSETKDAVIIDRFIKYSFLVLDDFGAENITEFTASALYMIVNGRLSEEKPTIVTSNLAMEEINETMPRIASRFAEYEIWDFSNKPDYRKNR